MSLLLDALKKAADDKKKASHTGPHDKDTAQISSDKIQASTNNHVVNETEDTLTLDPVEINAPETTANTAQEKIPTPAEYIAEAAAEHASESVVEAKNKNSKNAKTAAYTVSDEALSMLIRNTNRDVKQNKRIVIASVFLLSSIILVAGGFYYYMEMQTEITTLERKHRIAMRSMELKTNKEKIPKKSKIIRNLVGESGLDDKVQYAKKHIAEKKNTQQIKPRPGNALKNNNNINTASSTVSFKKTNKVDPVSEKLQRAWLAYENAQYDQAKKSYEDVLLIEKNNRDALLGLGAIATIEKNNVAAKQIYALLLKLDPRDPIAISALASLRADAPATEVDEQHLLKMLQKNPGDSHLNFALGNVYAQQAKWKAAQQSYFNAWQGDNENADYIFNLAVSLDQLGKREQAINFYQRSLKQSANKQVAFSRDAVKKRISELSNL